MLVIFCRQCTGNGSAHSASS